MLLNIHQHKISDLLLQNIRGGQEGGIVGLIFFFAAAINTWKSTVNSGYFRNNQRRERSYFEVTFSSQTWIFFEWMQIGFVDATIRHLPK
jgi:hypothetical protein